jgi:hypothetical protein
MIIISNYSVSYYYYVSCHTPRTLAPFVLTTA